MIIITGGAGFIGSAFLWKCNQEGLKDILIVDNLTPSKQRNLDHLTYAGYCDKTEFLDKLETNTYNDVTAIIHMGACSSTTEMNLDYLHTNNFDYTRRIAQWCLENDCRLIYASSAATYGDGSQGFSDDINLIPHLKPINPYGDSKQQFDCLSLEKGWIDKLVGLKFFNVFGPNEYHKEGMRSVICKAHPQLIETKTMNLFKSNHPDFSDGGQCRDFIYIKDCVDVMWWLLQKPQVNGIFNLGTGKARTWNDVANAMFSALNIPPAITYIDMPDNLKNQYQNFTQADMTKLFSAGCPVSFTPLEDAVADYIQLYLDKDKHLS